MQKIVFDSIFFNFPKVNSCDFGKLQQRGIGCCLYCDGGTNESMLCIGYVGEFIAQYQLKILHKMMQHSFTSTSRMVSGLLSGCRKPLSMMLSNSCTDCLNFDDLGAISSNCSMPVTLKVVEGSMFLLEPSAVMSAEDPELLVSLVLPLLLLMLFTCTSVIFVCGLGRFLLTEAIRRHCCCYSFCFGAS